MARTPLQGPPRLPPRGRQVAPDLPTVAEHRSPPRLRVRCSTLRPPRGPQRHLRLFSPGPYGPASPSRAQTARRSRSRVESFLRRSMPAAALPRLTLAAHPAPPSRLIPLPLSRNRSRLPCPLLPTGPVVRVARCRVARQSAAARATEAEQRCPALMSAKRTSGTQPSQRIRHLRRAKSRLLHKSVQFQP